MKTNKKIYARPSIRVLDMVSELLILSEIDTKPSVEDPKEETDDLLPDGVVLFSQEEQTRSIWE